MCFGGSLVSQDMVDGGRNLIIETNGVCKPHRAAGDAFSNCGWKGKGDRGEMAYTLLRCYNYGGKTTRLTRKA